MKRFRYAEKGFTLIELLIVIAILGILAAVIVPIIGGFMGTGEVEAANTEYKTLQTTVMAIIADAGQSDVTEELVDIGVDIKVGDTTYLLSNYMTGTLKGTYSINTSGVIEGESYPGNVTWDDTNHVWMKTP